MRRAVASVLIVLTLAAAPPALAQSRDQQQSSSRSSSRGTRGMIKLAILGLVVVVPFVWKLVTGGSTSEQAEREAPKEKEQDEESA